MDKVELESIELMLRGTPVESQPIWNYPEITPKIFGKSAQIDIKPV
jgi:hypothetical protein